MGQDEFASLVELIYDSVDTERGWVPMLDVLEDTFSASVAHLFVRDPDTAKVVEHGFTGPYDLEATFNRLLPTDPSMPLGLANPNAIINEIDHYSESYLESTPIYNEVFRHLGSHYRVTSTLSISAPFDGGFALTRAKSMGAFGKEEVRCLELLLPHMIRAFKLQRRIRELESQADDIAAALDGLPMAALIVSDSLKIIHLNRQADDLLACCPTLRVRRGELVPERASEASALRKAVEDATALADGVIEEPTPPPQVVQISRNGKLPLEALAVPLRPRYEIRQNTGENARALLMIYDPEARPTIDPALLERLFDLTATEAFVAARLAEGMSITEIAQMRRCSRSTVRTHVKRIFQKTHTNRQGELVQLILTSPAISFGE